jgi:hypothetical protein
VVAEDRDALALVNEEDLVRVGVLVERNLPAFPERRDHHPDPLRAGLRGNLDDAASGVSQLLPLIGL